MLLLCKSAKASINEGLFIVRQAVQPWGQWHKPSASVGQKVARLHTQDVQHCTKGV